MEMVKIRLLKRHYRHDVGDILEVRPMEAKALKAVGVAEYYVAPARRTTTATRVMQPETIQSSSTVSAPPTVENAEAETKADPSDSSDGSGTEGYNRRDMRPQE